MEGSSKPCGDDLRTLLSRHVDGELSIEEQEKVTEHLAGCEGCRELLSLFQKNENLVSNALSGESFGNEVITSVISELRNEVPPEAKPVEEGAWEWLRTRPLAQLAAAAVLVVGVMVILNVSHGRQMSALQNEVAGHKKQVAETKTLHEKTLQVNSEQTSQMLALFKTQNDQITDLATSRAVAAAGPLWALTYQDQDHHLVVKMAPDSKAGTKYEIYRRLEKDDLWQKLNGPLELHTPEFTDRTAKPGETYVYKFRIYRPGAEPVDSPPYRMRLPFAGDLSPEKSIRIHCVDLGKQRDTGAFILERLINGKTVAERFYPSVGQRVGGVRDVPGVGKVDFTTDLVLHSVKDGLEALTVQYTAPVYDPDGKLVIREVSNGVFVPLTHEYSVLVSKRPNERAIFKPVDAPAQPGVDLWKGGWITVRARD